MGFWKKIKDTFKKVTKPVTDLFSGAVDVGKNLLGISMTEELEKARRQAQSQYASEAAKAEETARLIAAEDEERRRRLAAMGTQEPATLLGSYAGITAPARLKKTKLGGY